MLGTNVLIIRNTVDCYSWDSGKVFAPMIDSIPLLLSEFKNLNFLLNRLFNKKRKKINKTLIELFSEEDLSKIKIDFNLRPDQLSLEDYVSLAKINIKNG